MTVEVVLRNPLDKTDYISYFINVYDTAMAKLWIDALKEILTQRLYLEKNFCFLGFPDSQRTLTFICRELNWARNTINRFFENEYLIDDVYSPETMFVNLSINHDIMNRLHNHFEILQGTVNNLSDWYRRADYKTKFAIRQLNNLCHEAESLMLSLRKQVKMPYWIRPSQITTFLTARRYPFPQDHKKVFDLSNYDRKFGEVYLHWAQIGKTIYEVFRDEKGKDIDDTICSAITHLKYYTGEFDIEWGRNIEYHSDTFWHTEEMDAFKVWLEKNQFDLLDNSYNFGYHPIGQVDLQKSFGTTDFTEILKTLSNHLDIYKIRVDNIECEFNYNWTDENYYPEQIKMLIPGYDYSSKTILRE